MTLDVVTYNTGQRNADKLPELFRRFSNADVVGLQEAEKHISKFLSVNDGWKIPPFAFRKEPVFYNSRRVTLTGYGSIFLTPATRVGSPGAGPATLIEKWANFVRVAVKGGGPTDEYWVVNWHGAPSIQLDLRDELHEEQIRNINSICSRLLGKRIWLGDFNAEWNHPNLIPLRGEWTLLNPKGDTMGHRQIDLILGAGGLRHSGGGVMMGVDKDDHRAVRVQVK